MKGMQNYLDKRQNKSTPSSNDIFIIFVIFLTLLFIAVGSYLYFYGSSNREDIEDFAFNNPQTQNSD